MRLASKCIRGCPRIPFVPTDTKTYFVIVPEYVPRSTDRYVRFQKPLWMDPMEEERFRSLFFEQQCDNKLTYVVGVSFP